MLRYVSTSISNTGKLSGSFTLEAEIWRFICKFSITFLTKVRVVKATGFSSSHVQMWELDYKECWALKNWNVVLEKTLESPLDSKEIKPSNPKGNQPWTFIGRIGAEAETPIVYLSDVKSQLTEKHPDTGKDWGQEEKGETEDEMVRWHHRLNAHEFE